MTRPGELVLRVRAADAAGAEVAVTLDPAFAGFRGHFPGAPVLPGMCHADLAVRAASAAQRRPLELVAVERARFLVRVPPGVELRIRLAYDGAGAIDARHFVDERLVAELRLEVRPVVSPPTA